MNNNTEYQAGAALVNDGIKFPVSLWFGIKVHLNIKPCKPGTVVRISQKILQLEKVDVDHPTVQEFMGSGNNIKTIAGIVATAVINREFLKGWQYLPVKWLILNRVEDMEHLYSYFLLVQRQMGPLFFYRIMELTPAMNYLKRRDQENSGEEKHSGEPSHSSKRHSD